ncbi:uncharacterized protein zgc:112982 isoform X2 [Betta splendens]|uniref:Uncharacterized protein zgc:112982 isoform X2 n=1 Tax=Betta splendens TaxID=158456 RepID=A0A8M1HD08_BETSP|nr:uncharacterized protein zgc:112982 isoform X2 [Betta splendens]
MPEIVSVLGHLPRRCYLNISAAIFLALEGRLHTSKLLLTAMSRPRSRSPRSRRLLWEKLGFDPHRAGVAQDRSHRFRQPPEEQFFKDPFREDRFREGQRRSPYFTEERPFRNPNPSKEEEFHHRRDVVGHDDRRCSPVGGTGGERHRGGFREQLQSFKTRGRRPFSAMRLDRERSPSTTQSHSDYQQRRMEMGWRREEQETGGGRFRDIIPGAALDDRRGATGRERQGSWKAQGPNGDRRWEGSHQKESLSERNPPPKRQRRDVNGTNHLGYRNEENFGERRYSLDTPRDGFVGERQRSHPHIDIRKKEPLVIDHDHGITNSRVLPRWAQYEERRDCDPNVDLQRNPRIMGTSQELLKSSNHRLDGQEEKRRFHSQDNFKDANYLKTRRSPVHQERQNPERHDNRDGPTNQKRRTGPQPAGEKLNYGHDGRTGRARSQPRFQQGRQAPPHEEQTSGYRSLREDPGPGQGRHWEEDQRHQHWEHDGSESVDRHQQRSDLEPKLPHQRQRGWNDQKMDTMTVVTEETLTVKVDMSQPVKQNSSLCYSSDRQLSLDLVNVGRQRLDFLPILEHSGTYREAAAHTEQYFKGDSITLTERFSAPQQDCLPEEETEELTLNKRFSTNPGFSLNTSSLLDVDIPLFSRLGPVQDLNHLPVRDPGDLRHNLEKRRQERLEGVKVTIQGSNMSLRGLDPASELEFDDEEDLVPIEDEEVSILLQEQNRRQEINMAQRRAAPHFQSRNNRGRNQRGKMRLRNNNFPGPHW